MAEIDQKSYLLEKAGKRMGIDDAICHFRTQSEGFVLGIGFFGILVKLLVFASWRRH